MGTPDAVVVFSHTVCVTHYFMDIVDSAPRHRCFSHGHLFNCVHTYFLFVGGHVGKDVSREENFAPNHRIFGSNLGIHPPMLSKGWIHSFLQIFKSGNALDFLEPTSGTPWLRSGQSGFIIKWTPKERNKSPRTAPFLELVVFYWLTATNHSSQQSIRLSLMWMPIGMIKGRYGVLC